MSLPPFCDECGGNRGFHHVNGRCKQCIEHELRKGRKERIRKEEFDANNPEHFRLQTRGGAWRYYRKVESDPMIYVGDGQYRAKSLCSAADLERAAMLNSATNAGKL